jgi:uncharacterized protein (TIGR03086 family)
MTAYPILVEAERRLTALVESLQPAEFGRPTPCTGWDVRALLSHTLTGIEIFASTVDGQPAPTAEEMFSGGDRLGDDPVAAVKRATMRSQDAWADLADPAAPLTTILGVLPAGDMLAVSAFATVVHTWDIATATGRPTGDIPEHLIAHTRAVSHQFVPGLRGDDGGGLFQAELASPGDATPTQQLMAYLGRPAS